jgi:hypothetical protein
MSNMLEIEKHPHLCPVCGKYEFQTYDWYEICHVCGWEDNAMQNEDPDCAAGPNKMSLNDYRRAYLAGEMDWWADEWTEEKNFC